MSHPTDIDLSAVPEPSRQCGSCTACCEGWLVAEIEGKRVAPGHPCHHSTPRGCAIYATRPKHPCQDFVCGWIRWHSPLPSWMRPDQCGAIVILWYDWQDQKVINAVPVGEKIPEQTLNWLKDYAQKNGRPLLFSERILENDKIVGTRCLGFGPRSFIGKVERIKLASEQAELQTMFSGLQG